MRLAGETRISLKSLANDPAQKRVTWTTVNSQVALVVLDKNAVRSYTISQQISPERGFPLSVFDNAKKPSGSKLPSLGTLVKQSLTAQHQDSLREEEVDNAEIFPGFWPRMAASTSAQAPRLTHPLSFAEIESNAPYQPFHSDPRVSLSVYNEADDLEESQYPTVSAMLGSSSSPLATKQQQRRDLSQLHVFGIDIPTAQLNLQSYQHAEDDDPGGKSIIYRETTTSSLKAQADETGLEQIVTTTRRRKANKPVRTAAETEDGVDEEGFFEDDCDVLDFAGDRV